MVVMLGVSLLLVPAIGSNADVTRTVSPRAMILIGQEYWGKGGGTVDRRFEEKEERYNKIKGRR